MTFITKTGNRQHKLCKIIDIMRVFCNGFNLYGQLGLPEPLIERFTPVFGDKDLKNIFISHSFCVLQIINDFMIFFKNEQIKIKNCGNIVKVSCNDEKIIVLNDLGKLFKIELENFDLVHDMPNILQSDLSDERIISIDCGSKLYVAYSNKGKVFNIPNKLNFESEGIVDIKCGREHCILLDKFGNIFTFGRGSRGQLGHGQLGDETEPVQVEALAGIKIVQIAAGGWHSCAVSKDGDLYTWGWNSNGQLGLKTPGKEDKDCVSVMALPRVIDFLDRDRNCIKVSCGSRHTIALLDNNHLYGCGWNKYKQLKNDGKENFYAFTYLHDCSTEQVLELKCGPWNSVIICS